MIIVLFYYFLIVIFYHGLMALYTLMLFSYLYLLIIFISWKLRFMMIWWRFKLICLMMREVRKAATWLSIRLFGWGIWRKLAKKMRKIMEFRVFCDEISIRVRIIMRNNFVSIVVIIFIFIVAICYIFIYSCFNSFLSTFSTSILIVMNN